MTATGIHLLDLSVRLLGPAESVLCICEQLSSDLPQGDTVAAYVKFKGGGTSYVSASLANPFMSRFTVYGSKGWIDIRDKAHVEAPDGWIVTSAIAGGPIVTREIGKAEPVKDNLVSNHRRPSGEQHRAFGGGLCLGQKRTHRNRRLTRHSYEDQDESPYLRSAEQACRDQHPDADDH
jgi:predicted dehydrogenase